MAEDDGRGRAGIRLVSGGSVSDMGVDVGIGVLGDGAHEMVPGSAVHARSVPLADAHEPVEGWQLVSGDPTIAALELGTFAGTEFGLWEMATGSMVDVEVDEVFLVISGSATVEFLEPELPSIELVAGSIVRLGEGMRTRWTVTGAPLRKVYLVQRAV